MERATVPTGERVYAIGDIHGCLELLHELRQKIVADAASRPIQHNTVVYLGDYIDRGRNSKGVLDLLIREPLEGFESVHLMGNHEAFMRNFLRDGGYPMNWLWNGGDATLDSYGTGHENAEDLRQ